MNDRLDTLSAAAKEKLEKSPLPDWTEPMLATLTHDPFSDEEWMFERKLDGERCLAFGRDGNIRLMSRNRQPLNETYPEVVDALAGQDARRFVVDGEVVAFDGHVTSFSRLQARMHLSDPEEIAASPVNVYFYLFDVLYLGEHDLTGLPLRARKSLLKNSFQFDDPLRFTAHRNTAGEAFLAQACARGWEGLIAKRADSAYVHRRSRNWLKFKCVHRQEFVIGGYTDAQGERIGFGAILIGYYDDDALRYAGKVGTGYDDETLRALTKTFKARRRSSSPFDETVKEKHVHWIEPELVAQVGFTEWTDEGRLRHPRYLGLRRDKAPRDVVRESSR
jgi:DNA ligase D-like protein (predicted ligase)